MQGYLIFSIFIFWISPNLAKYTYGWSIIPLSNIPKLLKWKTTSFTEKRAGLGRAKFQQNCPDYSTVQPRYIPAQTDEFCHQRPRNWDSRFCVRKRICFSAELGEARCFHSLVWSATSFMICFFVCTKKACCSVAQGGRLEDRGKWCSDAVLGRRLSEQEDITLSVVSFVDSSTTHGYDIRRGCFHSCVAAALFRCVFHSRTPLVKTQREREKHDQFNQSLNPKMSS
jgi:hypothetical protein